MNILKSFFFLSLITFALSSCQNKEEVEVTPEVQEFMVTATSTTSSIELSWQNVEAVTWYVVNYGQSTADKSLSTSFQNPNTDEMTYTINGLMPNTEYEIFIEGTSDVNGVNMVAKSRSMKVSTERMTTTTPETETTTIKLTSGM